MECLSDRQREDEPGLIEQEATEITEAMSPFPLSRVNRDDSTLLALFAPVQMTAGKRANAEVSSDSFEEVHTNGHCGFGIL